MYLIAFYICVIIVLITVIDIIYIAVSFSNNKLSLTWPIQLLRIILGFQIKYDVNIIIISQIHLPVNKPKLMYDIILYTS